MSSWFYLKKLEIFNWWTFDKEVETFYLDKNITVVSWDNWSWKSTLIDALVSLLVPNQARKYNLSATDGWWRKSRNEASYVKWAYKNEETEEWIKTVYLRWVEKDTLTYSVILWYFFDDISGRAISLATFFKTNTSDSIDKFFIISEQELFIKNDFIHILNSADVNQISKLKSFLKTKSLTRIYDNFTAYKDDFSNIFWLKQNAIDLLNKVVSLKEIKDLNSFFRENMLDENKEILQELDEIEKNYIWVKEIYEKIVFSQKKLETLEPFMQYKKEFDENKIFLQEMNFFDENILYYSDFLKWNLIINETLKIEQSLKMKNIVSKEIEEKLEKSRQKSQEIQNLIQNSEFAKRLEKIEFDIKNISWELSQRKNHFENYTHLLWLLKIDFNGKQENFQENILKIKNLENSLQVEKKDIEQQKYLLKKQWDEKVWEHTELSKNLEYLLKRQDLVPEKLEKIRNFICKNLEINFWEIPFVCELIQVKEDEKSWEMPVEKLLHSFALEMLVPENLIQKVTEFVDKNDLKWKLKFNKIWNKILENNEINKNSLISKLDFKDNSLYCQFVKNTIITKFDYVCVWDISESDSQKYDKILTLHWLIKNKNSYLKDDRPFTLKDYILWWNTAYKINSLKKDIEQLSRSIQWWKEKLHNIDKIFIQIEQKLRGVVNLEYFDTFSKIDIHSSKRELENLEKEKNDIINNSSQIKNYYILLEKEKIFITSIEIEKITLHKEIWVLENDLNILKKSSEQIKNTLSKIDIEKILWLFINSKYQFEYANLENIDILKQEKINQIKNKKEKIQENLSSLNTKINGYASSYKEYKMTDSEKLEAPSQAISQEFFIYMENQYHIIKDEELYKYKQKFEKEFKNSLFIRLKDFYSFLENNEQKIKEKIASINKTLKEIPYSKDTFIEINLKPNNKKIDGIEDFKNDFHKKIIYKMELDIVDKFSEFEGLKSFMEQMINKDNEDRKTKVTDVRNWFLFSIKEKYLLSQETKDIYESSSGKSGWQTIKLAYLVLASSLLYQYGVKKINEWLFDNEFSKSFNLVAIDEVFAKLDMDNSKYVLDLFYRLWFQLFIITPTNTINVLENHVKTIYFISNPSWSKSEKHKLDIVSRTQIWETIYTPKISKEESSYLQTNSRKLHESMEELKLAFEE